MVCELNPAHPSALSELKKKVEPHFKIEILHKNLNI